MSRKYKKNYYINKYTTQVMQATTSRTKKSISSYMNTVVGFVSSICTILGFISMPRLDYMKEIMLNVYCLIPVLAVIFGIGSYWIVVAIRKFCMYLVISGTKSFGVPVLETEHRLQRYIYFIFLVGFWIIGCSVIVPWINVAHYNTEVFQKRFFLLLQFTVLAAVGVLDLLSVILHVFKSNMPMRYIVFVLRMMILAILFGGMASIILYTLYAIT